MKHYKFIKNLGDLSKEVNGWVPVCDKYDLNGEILRNFTIFNKLITIWLKPDGKSFASQCSCKLCGVYYYMKSNETNKFSCHLHLTNLKCDNFNNGINSISEYMKSMISNDIIFVYFGEWNANVCKNFDNEFKDFSSLLSFEIKLKFSTMWVSF